MRWSVDKISLQAAVVDRFYSREGYLVQFDSSRWALSKDVTIPIGSISKYLEERDYSFRRVLEFYARTAAPWHVMNIFYRFLHYCEQRQDSEVLSVASLISYRSSLSKKREWYIGVLRGAIRQWSRLGYPGISDEVLSLLDKWVIKGNEKGFAVQSMCPEDGPLTDIGYCDGGRWFYRPTSYVGGGLPINDIGDDGASPRTNRGTQAQGPRIQYARKLWHQFPQGQAAKYTLAQCFQPFCDR